MLRYRGCGSKLRPANLIFPCMGTYETMSHFVNAPRHVAATLNNPALVYHSQDRCAEAEPRYRRSLTIKEKMLDPDHPDAGPSLNSPPKATSLSTVQLSSRSFDMRQIDHSQFSLLPFGRGQSRSMTLPRWIAGKHPVQRRNQLRGCCDMVISARAGKG